MLVDVYILLNFSFDSKVRPQSRKNFLKGKEAWGEEKQGAQKEKVNRAFDLKYLLCGPEI